MHMITGVLLPVSGWAIIIKQLGDAILLLNRPIFNIDLFCYFQDDSLGSYVCSIYIAAIDNRLSMMLLLNNLLYITSVYHVYIMRTYFIG